MSRDMDKWLAYRNLLCAGDHIDELLNRVESTSEKSSLLAAQQLVTGLRDVIMPVEEDSRYHCLVKHLSIAYEAMREAYKGTEKSVEKAQLELLYALNIQMLEKLWGRKIEVCERCTEGGNNESTGVQEESSGGATSTIVGGHTQSIIQGGGDN